MRIGDLPVIRVKYFHASSNFDTFSHLYQSSMTLEEIIHCLSLKQSYFQKIVLRYPLKDYRFSTYRQTIRNYIIGCVTFSILLIVPLSPNCSANVL